VGRIGARVICLAELPGLAAAGENKQLSLNFAALTHLQTALEVRPVVENVVTYGLESDKRHIN
jgi:hypothetical protein